MTGGDKREYIQKLAIAVKNIAWGYLLLHFNVNLGRIDILPDWAGYLLILTALPVLGEKRPSALLLKPLGQLLAAYSGLVWFATILGWTNEIHVLRILPVVVSLYFHFQLLTDLAAVGQGPEGMMILHLRTVYTIVLTLIFLPSPKDNISNVTMVLAVTAMIVALCLCHTLFNLRRSLLVRVDGIAESVTYFSSAR